MFADIVELIGARGLYSDEQENNKQLRQLRRSPEYNLGQSRAALDLQLQQSIPTISIFDPMAGLSALPGSTSCFRTIKTKINMALGYGCKR